MPCDFGPLEGQQRGMPLSKPQIQAVRQAFNTPGRRPEEWSRSTLVASVRTQDPSWAALKRIKHNWGYTGGVHSGMDKSRVVGDLIAFILRQVC